MYTPRCRTNKIYFIQEKTEVVSRPRGCDSITQYCYTIIPFVIITEKYTTMIFCYHGNLDARPVLVQIQNGSCVTRLYFVPYFSSLICLLNNTSLVS